MKNCLPWEGSYAVEKEQPKREGAGQEKCYKQTAIPIP